MKNNGCTLLLFALIAFRANAEITFPVERPDLAASGSFTYQSKDLTKDTAGQQTITIKGRANNGYSIGVDQALNFDNGAPLEELSLDLGWRGKINDSPSEIKWLDFPLTAGKTWKSQSMWKNAMGASGPLDVKYTVVAIEDVTVPAGSFKAVKVYGTGWWNVSSFSVQGNVGRPTGNGQTNVDVWYAPEVKAIAKIEITKNVPSGVSHVVYELTAFKGQ
jgi:hypothetical protein